VIDRDPTSTATSVASIRLLIVDDDEVDRALVRRLLASSTLPLSITEACSAREAAQALEHGAFDVVILDVRLGDADGRELIPAILGESGGGRRAVIMVTGSTDDRSVVTAMRAGVYDYLSKSNLNREALELAIRGSVRWLESDRQLREAHERLTRLGLYDSLTGLPNRTLFFDRLEQARATLARTSAPFALLMMDLDFFKEVNDTLGHDAGDRLLCEVGARLRAQGRATDSFARMGGDEFTGLLPGVATAEAASAVAERISVAVRQPVLIDQHPVSVGVSIGIVIVDDATVASRELLARADWAMYAAKRAGRDFELYLEPAALGEPRPLQIAAELPAMLERHELRLHYQPKIDLDSGAIVGVEALARWTSPTLGAVSPAELIPIAERSPAIHELTRHVIQGAIDEHARWRTEGYTIPVAVNVSSRSLDHEGLVSWIDEALQSRDVAPSNLTLELTETALVSNTARAQSTLKQVRAMGVAVSIDDFGTGFTSFRYLRDFDITEIKVDGLFVRDLQRGQRDQTIVRSIAELASGFGVRLVAECIESQSQWPVLRALGCDVGQGFSIAHPMDGDSVPSWCRHWNARLPNRQDFYRGVRRYRPEAGAAIAERPSRRLHAT